jgi:CheY-like chemotaxis protein
MTAPAAQTALDAARKFRILHVEDDDLDAMNFQRAIRDSRWIAGVEVVRDGLEALEALRAGGFDRSRLVLLLDIRMPRMSGLELLAELRADPDLRVLPVVIMTTSVDEADVAAAYGKNVAGYICKSNDREHYRAAIAAFEQYWANVVMP